VIDFPTTIAEAEEVDYGCPAEQHAKKVSGDMGEHI